ncbi:hypothetical protein B0F90DRAFT_1824049 [Multifurca ochricompacta]|uniref:Uncharacterized protein n=1 Tax=Multifurca ochricompacta TaxID=376703 RepID=A0AAD4LV19_9AGAM|nr:hypothetical protein B0F90DRAFT_1824049 [Multifurca ochricompacta]
MSNPSSRQDEVRDESVVETSKVKLAVSGRLDNLNLISALSTALSNLLSIGVTSQLESFALPLLQTIISDCDQLDQKYNKEGQPPYENLAWWMKERPESSPFLCVFAVTKSQAAQLAVFCWGDSDPDALSKKLHGFVYALLTVTEKRLEDIESDYQDDSVPEESTTIGRDRRRPWLDTALLVQEHQEKLAKAFREHMTVDQGFRSSHDYRKDFFKAVVDEATKFMASCERVHKENRSPSPYGVDGNEVREAGLELCKFVDPEGYLDLLECPRRPLARAERELVELPVFSLFISTAGKFHVFSLEIGKDPSNRVANMNLSVLHPISESSFDDLMTPPEEDSVTEQNGYPLFGTHYDSLVKVKAERELMVLAKQKLLDGSITLDEDLNGQGALACLSVRFSLEFNPSHSYSRELARTQVEHHMRLCFVATTAGPRFRQRPRDNGPPTLSRRNEDKPFETAFEGYCLWFNHVINVKNSTLTLWEFITQGAMISFINKLRGVDIVLPVCQERQGLPVKIISQFLFDAMGPYQIRLFPKGRTPLPVVQMVFVLASSEAGA